MWYFTFIHSFPERLSHHATLSKGGHSFIRWFWQALLLSRLHRLRQWTTTSVIRTTCTACMTPFRGCKICYMKFRMIFNNCGGKTNRGCKICYVTFGMTFSNYEGKINNWRTITGIWQQILIICGTKSHSYVSPATSSYLLHFVLPHRTQYIFHKIQNIINCYIFKVALLVKANVCIDVYHQLQSDSHS